MENLEQLLNSLIEKGWKPFELDIEYIKIYSEMDIHCIYDKRYTKSFNTSYRKLVSKESGLWQFVCENGIRKERTPYNRDSDTYGFTIQDYQYRLIESALCDEDKLEEFLLNSIRLD